MTTADIAKIVYEAVRAYNEQVMGDYSQKSFDKLQPETRAEYEARVQFCVENPHAPASSMHDQWLIGKLYAGWTLADYTDAKQKKHKRLIPWTLLPKEEQVRDKLFFKIVNSLVETL